MAEFTVEGVEEINAKLNALMNVGPIGMKAAGQAVMQQLQEDYLAEGPGWTPRRDPRGKWKILNKTGHLFGSINLTSTDDTATIGTNVPYARALNFGYEPRNLVARPFMFLDDKRVELGLAAYMNQVVKAMGNK